MKFLKLEWKNIFSYGDEITSVDIGDASRLWQLSGKVGSGKSSLLSVPKLLLYGKTEGSDGKAVPIGDIANRTNKHGWIRGTIQKGKDLWIVERTFSPSGLSLFKNGDVVDKAGLKNLQDTIDSEILDGMPYTIFANVVTLSLNNFKSFISLSAADKRAIIDKIFSLDVINKVHELVKVDMKNIGNSINSSNSQIYVYEQTIKTSLQEIESIKSGKISASDERLAAIRISLEKVSELNNQQSELYNQTYNTYTEIQKNESLVMRERAVAENELRNVNNQIELFNMDRCPTCGTPLAGEGFDAIRNSLNETKIAIEEKISLFNENLNVLYENRTKCQNDMLKIQENINKIQRKASELSSEYSSIEAVKNSLSESESIKNIIKINQESKEKVEQSIKSLNEEMKTLTILEELYSAEGIKKQIMETYIPALNEEVAETLNILNFPYTLTFDANFDAKLGDMDGEVKPQSLSIGEHKEVDIAVLCSILKMVKKKYPQINLVFLDETVSSLDYESSTEIIKHLKEISTKMGLNIFIVSHTALDENLFDVHLSVEKKYGYSILSAN